MISCKKIKKVILVEDGLVLISKTNKQKEIPISELDKIYIKVNKVAPIYTFSYIVVSVFILIFSLWYLRFDMILILPVLLIVTVGVKLNDYKSYGLEICLKNGKYFKKRVPSELKYDAIEKVNIIRERIYDFKIENEEKLSHSH